MKDQRKVVIEKALDLARDAECEKIFLFLSTEGECRWFLKTDIPEGKKMILVIPKTVQVRDSELRGLCSGIIRSWAGNQTRFSRIKYAFLHGVMHDMIRPDSRVVCVLGPFEKDHLDTITIHDLALSWSEEFPFDVKALIQSRGFHAIMAVLDIALDIGALGREGRPVGTIFVIGDLENVLNHSHQAVFNPFRGYSKKERLVTLPDVVESLKELAKLDGAIIISDEGLVEAAGRHLDAGGSTLKKYRGLGARHRAAAGITRATNAVSIVVSESTGKITIFDKGRVVSTLEPVISRRIE